MTVPVVCYAAKSTADKHGSIGTQLEDCRKLAERDGLDVVAEYQDEAMSAYKGNRGDGLTRARAHAERLGAQLIVQHSDRLARGDGAVAQHLVEIVLWARKAGVTLRSVQDPQTFDTSGLVYAALMGDRNHEDSERKGAAVKDGLRRRAEHRGKLAGGPRPYGYRWVPELVDGRKVSHLDVVPEEGAVVRRIFEDTVNGASQLSIARALVAPTVRGGKWTQAVVRQILLNPLYAGRVRHNGEVFPGAYEPVITEELWRAAAAMRQTAIRTKGNGGGRPPTGPHLLTKGLLRCGWCLSAMTPTTYRPGEHVYRCHGRRVHGPDHCPQLPLDRAAVDDALLAEVLHRYVDLDETRDRLAARMAADVSVADAQVDAADREFAAAEARLQRVQRAFQDGYLEPADYRDQIAELRDGREAARAAIDQARDHAARLAECGPALDVETELLRRLADLRAAVADGIEKAPNLAATRTLLRRLFERLFYVAPGHPWLEKPGFVTDDMPAVGGGYLLPDLHEDVVEFVDADGNPYFNDVPDDATIEDLGPYDPDEPDPIGIIHRLALPLAEEPTLKASP